MTATAEVKCLPPLREALESLPKRGDGSPDIMAACIMAGGVKSNKIPQDRDGRREMIQKNGDARLALHALSNMKDKAAARADRTAAEAAQRGQDDGCGNFDTWYENIARFMTQEEFDSWISIGDQHLDMARVTKYEILPVLAEELPEEILLAMTVAKAVERYHMKYGCHPQGEFAVTVLEAY